MNEKWWGLFGRLCRRFDVAIIGGETWECEGCSIANGVHYHSDQHLIYY